ncbi:LRR receptor-like serine/threonine-protein kinase FLS2 [Alnus glutinosa]|uniref:LRR receptor-like serine/threonine-protein kinase FLS2 n=1 Tax=Alnus glutinosa TaxID=3517 RepID=UPI002D78E391|nr:LRR receptor-like serine/threonine-protein kinase FLS2 [Alnus glutinosa]
MGRLNKLQALYLENNRLEGSIPSDLCQLKSLSELYLTDNTLFGPILACVLRVLDLSRNLLSGDIATTILCGLKDMANLSLAGNQLEGPILESFGELVSLEFLNLSSNSLSGEIPNSLKALLYLKCLNVSFNRLRGKITVGRPFVHLFAASFMSNDGICGALQLQVTPCKEVEAKSLPLATWRRIFQQELLQATEGFNANNLLGKGSFESVYRGTLSDGMIVAIKVFNLEVVGAFKSFDTECGVLCNIHHRNLL